MVDSERIDRLIAAVPQALALRAGLDLDIFTRIGGSQRAGHRIMVARARGINSVELAMRGSRFVKPLESRRQVR